MFVSRISSLETKIGLGMQLLSFYSFGPILVFMFFGIFYSRNRLAELMLLLIPVITLSFGYSIFFTEIRYRIPIDGFLMILAVSGFFTVSNLFLQLKK